MALKHHFHIVYAMEGLTEIVYGCLVARAIRQNDSESEMLPGQL